jgi:hypothetical protein
MKIDDEQEVNELFQSSIKFDSSPVDISVKRFIFKIVGQISNEQRTSKVAINAIWRKYFDLPAEQQKNEQTGTSFLNSKEDLKRALEQMEADDLTMMDGDDVILTS